MLTLHTTRTGNQIIIPQDEFVILIRKVLEIQPVEVIERIEDDVATEDDIQAYYDAKAEFERGETIDFDAVKGEWKRGKIVSLSNISPKPMKYSLAELLAETTETEAEVDWGKPIGKEI